MNVDDNDIQRYAVTRMLKRAGFTVKEAANGEEALAMAGTKPDLILLDIKLPDIDGLEVCRRLKATPQTADIPVVHLTNIFKDVEAQQASAEAGAEYYLTHPIDANDLVTALSRFLHRTGRPLISYRSE